MRRVAAYAGVPQGREGQPLDWLRPEAMDPAHFPAADRPIITALRLPAAPAHHGPGPAGPGRPSWRVSSAPSGGGIRLVQLRAHELDDAAYRDLAERAFGSARRPAPDCCSTGTRRMSQSCPRHGLHLSARTARRTWTGAPAAPMTWSAPPATTPTSWPAPRALGLDYAAALPGQADPPTRTPSPWVGRASCAGRPRPTTRLRPGRASRPATCPPPSTGAQGIAAIRGLWPR